MKFNFIEVLAIILLSSVSAFIVAILVKIFYVDKIQYPISDNYEVFCIENVRYVSVNGMLAPKYGTNGEIEQCELEESI